MVAKKSKKIKNPLAINEKLLYNTFRCVDGLSPNGKATDSDSVIFLVRIQVAQLYGSGVFTQVKAAGSFLCVMGYLRFCGRLTTVFGRT